MVESKVPSPYPVKYTRRYMDQKVKYPVLQADTVDANKKEAMRAVSKTLITGDEAAHLVWEKKGFEHGWQYLTDIRELQGRVSMLRQNGIEVALFFERLITYEEPQPGAPVPVSEIKHPEDVWLRLDLLETSARQKNLFIKLTQDRLETENKLLNERVSALQQQVSLLETEEVKKEKLLELRKQSIDRLNQQLALAKGTKATPPKKKKKSDWGKRFKAAQQKLAEQKAKQALKGGKQNAAGKTGKRKNSRLSRHGKTRP